VAGQSGQRGCRKVLILLKPLSPELNPICYLLALLAHHFLHVSRIRVTSLTLRLLMSYIYIYIYIYIWSTYSWCF
jgi:transposase